MCSRISNTQLHGAALSFSHSASIHCVVRANVRKSHGKLGLSLEEMEMFYKENRNGYRPPNTLVVVWAKYNQNSTEVISVLPGASQKTIKGDSVA